MPTKIANATTPQAAITKSIYDQGTTGPNFEADRAGFHNMDRLTTVCNGTGATVHPDTGCAAATAQKIRIDHDPGGYEVKRRFFIDSVAIPYTVQTGRDSAGRVRYKSYPDADSVGSSGSQWQYDSAGRLLSIPTLISSMLYDARGRVLTANYVNGVVQAYDYTGVRLWLDKITTTKTSGAVNHQTLDYTRDLTGKITGVAETRRRPAQPDRHLCL